MLCTANEDKGMQFYQYRDTLSFQDQYYSSATNYQKLYINRYDLTIINQTDSTLTVKPSSKLSKKFFNDRTTLAFIKQEFNTDKSIHFEKIIYHTTSCFGSCPTIDLEIDNKRNIYIDGQFYKDDSMFENDTIKSGQFIGKLNDALYNELVTIIQTSNIKTLTFPERDGADAPVTTLIIYYNGKRKYLKSMFPPTIASKLIQYLYQINEKANLIRTTEKRILEK